MKCKDIGSSFDSWLREKGSYEEVTSGAIAVGRELRLELV